MAARHTDDDDGFTLRDVTVRACGRDGVEAYVADVTLWHRRETPQGTETTGSENAGRYAFVRLDHAEESVDVVRGDTDSLDADYPAVLHVGSSPGNPFYRSHDEETVPVDVLEEVRDSGLSLVEGVGGGWESWDGRPEWSDTYLDVTAAEAVDLTARIQARRDDDTEPEEAGGA